ncbi:hypothetical protein [Paenibacillus sp. FSL R5-0810]|uniref:hypothetical protein n=1 Tax=Paenibacillus sp. FSL R5-0810 TaxID=2921659 RepID=UPI0030FB93CA
MTNPVTPNIGLNKIDRTSPATTYFDLEKYIDQNADTVDRFAGEASQAIDALQQRLDTEARREVVLQPGLQIVNAERSAPFSLSGIKGRTLVNLLGRDGNFETIISTVLNSNTVSALDNTSWNSGSNSINVTAIGTGTVEHYADMMAGYKAKQGRYYIFLGMVKVNKGAAQIKIYSNLPQTSSDFFMSESNIVSQIGGAYSLVRTTFRPKVDCDVVPRLYLLKDSRTPLYEQNGESSNFDSLRIFEVSKEEFDSFGSLTNEDMAAKYPYVDGVQPVCNPYAIRYGENLLPPFYEWGYISVSGGKIQSPYSLIIDSNAGATLNAWVKLTVLKNTEYTLSAEHNGKIAVYDTTQLNEIVPYTTEKAVVFNTGNNEIISIFFSVISSGTGIATINNPMLNIGTKALPFKPCEDSMLAFQTELYANPSDGSDQDVLFEREGQYFKLAKWKKIVLDGSFPWQRGSQKAAGYQSVFFESDDLNYLTGIGAATKFNGKVLSVKEGHPNTAVDEVGLYPQFGKRIIYLKIANTDSGWGDNYTPTPDEIKAYFMGWKMYDGLSGSNPYTSGTKAWCYRLPGQGDGYAGGTNTFPSSPAPNWTPYQLVYQLATPTVEPIVSEGMLTFNVGDNQIEVGTGIVLRESTTPVNAGDGTFWINGRTSPSFPLSKKPSKMLYVYKNNLPDNAWMFRPVDQGYESIHGLVQARLGVGHFDISAVYSVTYLMLNKSPMVPVTGSYAANEKIIYQELTDAVHQNASVVSVMMQQKAEKDAPVVKIMPTLLNGWVNYAGGYQLVQYYKDTSGVVHLTGLVKSGPVTSNIFKLARGFRPKAPLIFNIHGNPDTARRVDILTDGFVYFHYAGAWDTSTGWISLDGISFLAEQ